MAGLSIDKAAVVRCHRCNEQTTYVPPATVPERCPTCQHILERRADATVTTLRVEP